MRMVVLVSVMAVVLVSVMAVVLVPVMVVALVPVMVVALVPVMVVALVPVMVLATVLVKLVERRLVVEQSVTNGSFMLGPAGDRRAPELVARDVGRIRMNRSWFLETLLA